MSHDIGQPLVHNCDQVNNAALCWPCSPPLFPYPHFCSLGTCSNKGHTHKSLFQGLHVGRAENTSKDTKFLHIFMFLQDKFLYLELLSQSTFWYFLLEFSWFTMLCLSKYFLLFIYFAASGLSCCLWIFTSESVGSFFIAAQGLLSGLVRWPSCRAACGILVPWPGIKPSSPALEGRFLTTGPPWKSLKTQS